jgi:outer membrane receptor for ferrienterochelin and colicins
LETALSLYLFENFFIDMNICFTDAQNETNNKDLIEIPKRTAGLVLKYIPTNNFEIRTVTKYVGSQYSDEYEKLGSFTTTNLKVNFKEVVKNIDLFAGVDNIFDKQMDEYLGYIPQSSFYAGIKYRF